MAHSGRQPQLAGQVADEVWNTAALDIEQRATQDARPPLLLRRLVQVGNEDVAMTSQVLGPPDDALRAVKEAE